MAIDPNAPDAPEQLAARAGTILAALYEIGVRPLENSEDLLLLSLMPLAIKKILTGRSDVDQRELLELIDQIDLTVLKHLIRGE